MQTTNFLSFMINLSGNVSKLDFRCSCGIECVAYAIMAVKFNFLHLTSSMRTFPICIHKNATTSDHFAKEKEWKKDKTLRAIFTSIQNAYGIEGKTYHMDFMCVEIAFFHLVCIHVRIWISIRWIGSAFLILFNETICKTSKVIFRISKISHFIRASLAKWIQYLLKRLIFFSFYAHDKDFCIRFTLSRFPPLGDFIWFYCIRFH